MLMHLPRRIKKKKKGKKKKASIICDDSTGRGDAVTLPLSSVLKSKPKPASLLMDTTNTAPPVQLKDQGTLVQSIPKERQVAGRDGQSASSPSTSSALTSKPKPKPAFLLVDTTNTAPAVQLKDQGILVQNVPEESQVSGRDEQAKRFEELINKGQISQRHFLAMNTKTPHTYEYGTAGFRMEASLLKPIAIRIGLLAAHLSSIGAGQVDWGHDHCFSQPSPG